MSMNQYHRDLSEIKSHQCKACHGLGTQDDASEYDIMYNTWTCDNCEGTGYAHT